MSESGTTRAVTGPIHDRAGTIWRGSLPGLGSVEVAADGSVTVAADHPDGTGDEAAALLHGWGELLSFAHRGFAMAQGACLAPPGSAPGALLVCGDAHDVAAVVLSLTARDWALISDRPTPTRWEDGALVAHPRPAPLVVGERMAAESGRTGTPVRAASTAVAVDVSRALSPAPVTRVVLVQRRRPDEDTFAMLTGHRRFERAASLMLRGALSPRTPQGVAPDEDALADDTASVVAEHLRLAELPSAVVRIDTAGNDDAVHRLLEWWAG